MTEVADWSVLEYPGVDNMCRKVAGRVAREYDDVVLYDADDLYQEGVIILATKADVVRRYLAGPDGLGGLGHWLRCDLVNKVATEVRRDSRRISLDALSDGGEDE